MVDEKGRLFGKINLIDLLVILIAIAIVLVVGLKLLGGGGFFGDKVPTTTIYYVVKVSGVDPDVFTAIQSYPDDPLMAAGHIIQGSKVISVVSEPHVANATITTREGALVVPLDEDLLDLTFTIQASVEDSIKNEVGTQEVRIGKTHIVKTQHYELINGVITGCTWSDNSAS